MNDERPWTGEFIDLISDDKPINVNIEKVFALKDRNLPKRLFKFRRDSGKWIAEFCPIPGEGWR